VSCWRSSPSAATSAAELARRWCPAASFSASSAASIAIFHSLAASRRSASARWYRARTSAGRPVEAGHAEHLAEDRSRALLIVGVDTRLEPPEQVGDRGIDDGLQFGGWLGGQILDRAHGELEVARPEQRTHHQRQHVAGDVVSPSRSSSFCGSCSVSAMRSRSPLRS
jgi:hypothetical protein